MSQAVSGIERSLELEPFVGSKHPEDGEAAPITSGTACTLSLFLKNYLLMFFSVPTNTLFLLFQNAPQKFES